MRYKYSCKTSACSAIIYWWKRKKMHLMFSDVTSSQSNKNDVESLMEIVLSQVSFRPRKIHLWDNAVLPKSTLFLHHNLPFKLHIYTSTSRRLITLHTVPITDSLRPSQLLQRLMERNFDRKYWLCTKKYFKRQLSIKNFFFLANI